ncbi:hypothetical protein GCM10022236_42780 [Microlunatus ginsengisoli]|uniref:CARDB protein n=1 Tax=Microlunatus ginsengisoli TaxID=363863 RepID=A0ABP7ALM6_9ACTN
MRMSGLKLGSHYVEFYLDVDNAIPEVNKTNNTSTHGFEVGLPDGPWEEIPFKADAGIN